MSLHHAGKVGASEARSSRPACQKTISLPSRDWIGGSLCTLCPLCLKPFTRVAATAFNHRGHRAHRERPRRERVGTRGRNSLGASGARPTRPLASSFPALVQRPQPGVQSQCLGVSVSRKERLSRRRGCRGVRPTIQEASGAEERRSNSRRRDC